MTSQRVRASNSQRDRVVEHLNRALAEGRITPAEFEERSAAASRTVWADELSPFTADLPRRATLHQRLYVVERLGDAAAQGYISFPEFEERSAAVNHTLWHDDLRRFTHDLPAAFQVVPEPVAAIPARSEGNRKKVKHPLGTAIAVALIVLTGGIGIPLLLRHDSASTSAPSIDAPRPVASPAVTSAVPVTTTSPAVARTTSAPARAEAPPAPPPFTIECSVGDSGNEKTFTSLKKAWAENDGTYSCEASVPESHRLSRLENAAVTIDQRTGNGENNIEALESLLSLCADTMKFEFNYDDILEPKPEPRPFTVDDFTDFDPDRLQAMYKLCPHAPTARRMREAIYSR
ncbi:DUF1707 domain-containing protein [Actinoplanes sp. NPDC049548]|uniref:DUF1707 SHOCT-like domain-containing protein n=1 Tax=Actinoplanes sp. NPDC049548 TaxID=3155152 RepID=UPI00342B9662